MENKKKSIMEKIGAILAVATFYGVLQLFGITCPIKFLTGISCPGCGMTRAWISAFMLDFQSAFYYHPLFFIIPFVIPLFIYKSRIPHKIYLTSILTLVSFFVIIYMYRMIFVENSVVVFEPCDNALFRALRWLNINI